MESSAFIEIDMFPEEVDSMDHWKVVYFKGVLEEVAEEYRCSLVHFEIDRGTVTFSFNSDELMANILNILQDDSKDKA